MTTQHPDRGTKLPTDTADDPGPNGPVVTGVQPEPPRASKWLIFVYTITMFAGSFALLTPTLFAVAYKVQQVDPQGKETALGVIVAVAAVINLLAGPLCGVLSDRTRLRWGRRRPWIVAGIIICAGSGLLMALATTTVSIGIGWAVYTVGLACALGAMNPVLAETIPSGQRGTVGALVGVGGQLAGVAGTLVGSMLTGDPLLLFLLPVAVLAVLFVVYAVTIPDGPAPAATERQSLGAVFRQLVFDPRRHRDFALVWLGRFLMQVGLTFLSTYQLYFLLDRLGLVPEDAGRQLAFVGGIGIAVTTLFAVVGGIVSDRLKRRKAFIYLASALSATGLVILAFANGVPQFATAVGFVLAAAGLFGSVDLALAGDVIPDSSEAGRWMGIYYVANTTSTALAPMFAPAILLIGGGGNYTALFLVGAVVALGAGLTAQRIRAVR
ncbi:MFS family permease [Thermocatellispora tengchongensis]|uniref:MFS family permease n=1 Tax=Thermocatellispora tengchongensis TaxID=1073253 RepID=A0A840PJV0_9ACTN|nr:MFS transporter [Thermocatellispora tengchongensis]MBB5139808.1 MFS family permease [Thermocatellispora tengchongensis]